jgi:hypothetical protein
MTKLEKNWLEWICFAVSLLLVISLLGYLLYIAVTTGKSPAHIELQLGPPQERGGKFFINVVAENRGADGRRRLRRGCAQNQRQGRTRNVRHRSFTPARQTSGNRHFRDGPSPGLYGGGTRARIRRAVARLFSFGVTAGTKAGGAHPSRPGRV